MSDKPVIGFIGVGFMGHGMAKNIRQNGYELFVKGNRNRIPVDNLVSLGATEVATAKEMAQQCDVIHLCLSNSIQVEAAIRGDDGILAGGKAGLIVVDATTADPTSTEALAGELNAVGMHMVDAPLGRTPKEAEAGTLDAMVGADEDIFNQVLPILNCWAGNINHVGPVGTGHKMKLIMNFISMGYATLYGEAISLAAKTGLSPQSVRDVIGSSRLSNGFFDTFMKYTCDRDENAHLFTIANASKDVRYAANMAMANGISNPMGAVIRNYFAQAEAAGKSGHYVPMLGDYIGELNGLDIAAIVKAAEKK